MASMTAEKSMLDRTALCIPERRKNNESPAARGCKARLPIWYDSGTAQGHAVPRSRSNSSKCGVCRTSALLICVNPDKSISGGDIEVPPVIPGVSLLVTPARDVALWWCSLDRPAREIERCAERLAPDERARAERFGTDLLRDRYVAARATLRLLLGYALGVPPAEVPLQRGRRGRPAITGDTSIDFNVSHTQDVALIGVARNAAGFRIGVDVERIDRRVNADRLAHKFLTADEARLQIALTPDKRRENFLRYWTCKEAMSKATGDGLIAPFRNLSVELAERPRLIAGPPPYVPESWRLHAVAAPSGYLAALAIWTSRNS